MMEFQTTEIYDLRSLADITKTLAVLKGRILSDI
jgi:hypothetical protein